jgi:glycerol-3-phosphate dehydrogenase (NAD(P)+)
MKITILGAGAYGISLALMFNKNNCDVTLWDINEEVIKEIDELRTNKKVLENIYIPKNIKATNDLKKSILKSKIIVIAVPAEYVSEVVKELSKYITGRQHICIATKGIEQESCLFVSEIIRNNIKTKKIAVISGPSFAIDIANNAPIGMALASTNKKTASLLHESLENYTLKLRDTKDVIGVQVCGAIKNIIAISSGIINGMGLPESTQAMLITESLHDIKETIDILDGNKKTILSYAGFGDILLTCTSSKSRNFTYGNLIGSNAGKEEINDYVNNNTIEGLYTLESIHKLIKDNKAEIPIISLIYNIVFNNENPEKIKEFLITKK